MRRFLWLLALGVGSTIALAVSALLIHGQPIALQGRYLIGWYLPLLAVIATGVAFAEVPATEPARRFPWLRDPRPAG